MKSEPTFLALDDVLALHARSIEQFGGSHGIRDVGLLESALAMPAAGLGGDYFHPTLHEMAAAYLFHLCKNHPFVDGNKRTALASAAVFLQVNGRRLVAEPDALYEMVHGVAADAVSKAEAAVFFEKHTVPRLP